MSSRSVVGAVLAVAGALAAVAALGTPPRMSTNASTAAVVPVTSVELGCPQLPSRADTTLLAAAPGSSTGSRRGALWVQSMSARAGAHHVAERARRGLLRHVPARSDGKALVVSASGGLAPGTAAALASTATERKLTGLSAGWCDAPAQSWWFSGVDTGVGSTSRLILTNPSSAPAVIDLALYGRRGVVDAAGTQGIAVPGRSQRSIDLAGFAPGVDALTLHIAAVRGTVSAAVRTFQLSGRTPVGSDWVAPAAAPTTSLVVGPAVASKGRQRLVLANPGLREALAAISIYDLTGAFTPTRLTKIRVSPGAVVATDVTNILAGQAAAVSVTSNVALSAALTTTERRPSPDFTTVGTTQLLTAPAAVPLVPSTRVQLLLSTASRTGSRVRVDIVRADGERVRTVRIDVSGRTTTVWTPSRRGDGGYLVVRPQRGPAVHAIAWFTNRDGVAALPVVPGQWSLRLPVVQPVVRPVG
jgi:Family of unknown function (DUF5719)